MVRVLFILILFVGLIPSYVSAADEAGEEVERTFTIYTGFRVSEMEVYSTSFSTYIGLEAQKLRWIHVSEDVLMVLLRETKGDLKGDVVFGYSAGFLSASKSRGLLTSYRPYSRGETYGRFSDEGGFWSGLYFDLIGFGTDSAMLNEDPTLSPPRSWRDLIKPKWKGRIRMPSPEHSAAGLRIITTLVGLMGEDGAFEYLRRLNLNIRSYAQTESYMVNSGPGGGGVVIASSKALLKGGGFTLTYPREGTSFELVGLGILKGTPHLGLAQEFVDWALGASAGSLYQSFDSSRYLVPSEGVSFPPKIPLSNSFGYDRVQVGAERTRLLDKWRREVLRQGN